MKRLPKTEIVIEDEIVLVTTRTLHRLFQYASGADAVALYDFYGYTAKWQKTNQPKATDKFCRKGLGWGKVRFARAKKILLKEGLIQRIMIRQDGRIKGWYIKINYLWKKEKAEKIQSILMKKEIEENKNAENHQEEKQEHENEETNASCSLNNTSASSEIKRKTLIINDNNPASSWFEKEEKNFKSISEGKYNPRVKEIIMLFNKNIRYGLAGEHFIYTSSGIRIDADSVAANNLSKRYSMKCIKNALEFYKQEMKKDKEERKYLPQITTLDDLIKKMFKLIQYADERGLDLYSGIIFRNNSALEKSGIKKESGIVKLKKW